MEIMDFLKEKAKEERYSIRSLNDALNKQFGKETRYEVFFRKLKNKAIKYTEMEEIAELLGYEIVWKKKE